MNEIVEQINHYKWVLIHHRWIALLGAILISVIGWTYVQYIPDRYQSETRIYVDTESALKSLVSGIAIDMNVIADAASVMERTLLTRPNLERLINETDLKLRIDTSDPVQLQGMINQLSGSLRISSVSLSRNQARNIYSIRYNHTEPQMAKDVVDATLNIFVETILGDSRRDTVSAQQFLDKQIEIYNQKQLEAEERLKEFKQKYSRILPEAGRSFYANVNTLEDEIQDTEMGLSEAVSRSQTLQEQLDILINEAQNSNYSADLIQDPLDIRIENLETRLDELLLQYTERHPDVINTRRVIDLLQKQKLERLEEGDSTETLSNVVNSPIYQELNVRLSETKAQISSLQARLVEMGKQREELNEEIINLSSIEAELSSLNRDYAVTQKIYQDLVLRRESSQIGTQAEQTGEDLQFRIMEPPRVPLNPVSPNRPYLETLVLIAAIGAGIGLAILFELVRPTFYTRSQLNDHIELPVLGVVSMFWTNKEVTRRRLGIAAFSVITLMLLISYAGVLMHDGKYTGMTDLINQIIN